MGLSLTDLLSTNSDICGQVRITLTSLSVVTAFATIFFLGVIFSVNTVSLPAAWQHPEWRLTLDEPEDLKLFEVIYSSIGVGKRPLYFSEIVTFFEKRPEIARINESIQLKWKDDIELVARIDASTKLTKK